MPILRKIKRKENGVEETVHLGALAQNITQDATHRFVTDTEKQAWNSKPGSTSGLDNNVVTFTEAATRENLQSGEKLSISLGKIKKWFSDLGAAAFMAVANNCTTTQPGSVLAAEQGKKLQDQISQVSSEIADAKQELGGIEYGTVTVTEAASADLKGVHKVNKTAYLFLHGKTVTNALTSGIAHFQSSIPPASPTYIPYYIQNGAASRVQLAYIDQNGNISLAGGEDINLGETFLFYAQFRTT